ncbi:hypothetical protein Ocin01_05747 [Orchesella cincta]|uniref:Uncharacterized protein n=1 Tax=Orchesella cincta TaxID=48709 RepID=A0A1D2N6P1_ORCCI|nr:hypothetical protein Ocin01_05747 [Orchesella cincta]
MSVSAMIAGPVIGLIVVVLIYVLGIVVSIKCCGSDEAFRESAINSRIPHRILDPSSNLDVYIIARPQEYYNLNIPRPTLIAQQPRRNLRDAVAAGPAPAYENPPAYEDCVPDGIV